MSEFVRTNPPPGFEGTPQVSFHETHEGASPDPFVCVTQLGGFLSWGVVVGSSNFSMPASRNCLEWIPGVYVCVYP